MRVPACLALAAAVGCASAGGGRTTERPVEIEPARLVPTPVAGVGKFTARIRVYVDVGYKGQNPAHEQQIRRLLSGAFRILEPTIGVALGEVEFRSWEREPGSDLKMMLAELEALDPGEDVDWVLGFVDAQGHVAADVHQLGEARALGKHAVLRGLDDRGEVAVLDSALASMSGQDRRALYERRKQHKELVLLLHELGHTLGAMHVTGNDRIMSPGYDVAQSSFEVPTARLMAVAAKARFGGSRAEPDREWRAVLDYIRQHPWSGWNEDERDRIVTELEGRVKSVGEGGTAGMLLGGKVRPEDRERFRAAERLHGSGRPADAWEQLEPLIEFYPDEPSVQLLSCRIAVAAGKDQALVAKRCERAQQLAPGDPEPNVRLAQAALAGKDQAKAAAAAEKAHKQLAAMSPAVKKELAAVWKELGAVTRVEEAGQGDAELTGWARALRSRYGIAPKVVAPEREAAYVAAIRELLKLVYARKFDAAEKRAAQMRKDYGDAAGIDASLCDLEVRRKKYPAARALCEKAIARYADEAWAHYLLGLLDKHDQKAAAAIQHLEKAIALDPELQNAYQVLAGLYGTARKEDGARLRKAYKEQFGSDLP